MSDHLRLVSDNTKAALVPCPLFKTPNPAPRDYVQSFVFLEDNGVLVIMHNGKEVTPLAAVDAMAAVAAKLYRRSMAAQAAAPIVPAPRAGEVCAEIDGDGA